MTKLWKFIADVFNKVVDKDLFAQSASLSFYSALSLTPLLIVVIAALSVVAEGTTDAILTQIESIMGEQSAEIVFSVISSAKQSPSHFKSFSEIFSFLFILFTASSGFVQLKKTLNDIFSIKDEETIVSVFTWIKLRLLIVAIMMVFLTISIISLFISFWTSLAISESAGFEYRLMNQIFSFIIYSLIFSSVFYVIPKHKVNKLNSIIGGCVATVFFMVGKYGISVYLSQMAVGSAYGAAGSLMVLLVWIYYSSFIFYLAAVITSLLPKYLFR